MSFMKRKLFSIGLIFITLGIGCLLLVHFHKASASYRTSEVNTGLNSVFASATASVTDAKPNIQVVQGITFEVVADQAAQEKGLGGRANITNNYGMLFVFPTDGNYGFWMKDMLASIDMVWISGDGSIASITPSVAPDTYPTVFYPPTPIRYVLETQAGFAMKKGWKIGTKIALPLPYGK
jgi:uncharacterized membrane protein (UPF0127 family)